MSTQEMNQDVFRNIADYALEEKFLGSRPSAPASSLTQSSTQPAAQSKKQRVFVPMAAPLHETADEDGDCDRPQARGQANSSASMKPPVATNTQRADKQQALKGANRFSGDAQLMPAPTGLPRRQPSKAGDNGGMLTPAEGSGTPHMPPLHAQRQPPIVVTSYMTKQVDNQPMWWSQRNQGGLPPVTVTGVAPWAQASAGRTGYNNETGLSSSQQQACLPQFEL
jgi:hypothetical protein